MVEMVVLVAVVVMVVAMWRYGGGANSGIWWLGCRSNNGGRGGGNASGRNGGNGGGCSYGGDGSGDGNNGGDNGGSGGCGCDDTDGNCGGGNNGGGNGIGGISFSFVSALNGGFSVDLIHRDSPKSPFYNHSLTPAERLRNAFRRSINRINHFNPTASSLSQQAGLNQAEATIISDNGEYLLDLSIGTPPFPIKGIADTGSDLIWTQCNPCVSCYKQKDPLFEPKKSSTYKALSCSSSQCNSLNGTCSSESSSNCQYEVTYGDQSYSYGDFARETLTLESTTGRNIAFPETLIGCGFDNKFTAGRGSASGIVGLGGGSESLITQLGSSIGGKFSHCLVPLGSETTSKLNFGSNAVVTGAGVVSTPIVQGQDPKTFYFLTLEGISVGNTRIPSSSSAFSSGEGNIIIDSGTTLTLLPPSMYSDLEAEVDKAVGSLEHVRLPGVPLNLCYKISESSSDDFNPPTITVHFSGGDLKLPPTNTFIRVSEEAVCFAFGSSPSVSIFGNLSQMNFLVGYDTKEGTVSFKPTDCTKQQ
ncbi:aspartic proteinase CDR1-like [Pyrus communis]|uniref:aspartic proteinase CDR1-like n=1 Tax=Pyrus communis TaxID=23211 RepID=UPI0035C04D21